QDNPLVYVNQGFLDLTGYTRDELIGRNCRLLQRRPDGTYDQNQDHLDRLREAIRNGEFAKARQRHGHRHRRGLPAAPLRRVSARVHRHGAQPRRQRPGPLHRPPPRRADGRHDRRREPGRRRYDHHHHPAARAGRRRRARGARIAHRVPHGRHGTAPGGGRQRRDPHRTGGYAG
ncbi:MAG: PAS domain-containing protein, partial [Bacteroidetes bacterium]|nr:PAS domain-containing protein [Bacteroidota bacterium]